MSDLRIALFVEGSFSPPPPRGQQRPLDRIWNEDLKEALDLRPFALIVPISKRHLVAMDPRNPPMSGAGEPLDALIARMLRRNPFDVAVIAWDLVPAWNPEDAFCRWHETLDLYRFLAASTELPDLWKRKAAERYEALSERQIPSRRAAPPSLESGMVLPVCMDPMFESLLSYDEAAIKRALGISGRIQDWPSKGWGTSLRRPDQDLLAPAIGSLTRMRPRPPVLRTLRGDMKTNKDGWGEYLLRRLLADKEARQTLLDQPLCRRLRELIHQSR
jgi:hypothetical protein